MQNLRWTGLALVLMLAGCGGSTAEGPRPIESAANEPPPAAAEGPLACGLPAPVVSEDACSQNADCAPAEPCHAHACVAVAHAAPRTPETACTTIIDCKSVDVNPCVCHEGRCALVPKPN